MAKIQDIDIPHLEFAEAAAPGTPASGIVRTYAKADGLMYSKDDAGVETLMSGGAGGGSLTSSTNQLGADVTMTTANTYYDGPSLSLAAGTWLLIGVVTIHDPNESCKFTAKLWNGTTVVSSAESANLNSLAVAIPLVGIASPGSTTTYKISVAGNGSSSLIKAAATLNGAGNNASTLTAVKIA